MALSQPPHSADHADHHLLLFARFPSPGTCKTRLIPRLGPGGSASFCLAALADTLHMLAALPVHKTLFYTPASAREAVSHFLDTHSLKSLWDFQPQVPGPDLGSRLAGGLEQARARLQGTKLRSSSVTFIGMDCFDLTPSRILDSLSLSSASSAYMLPASDGGYVLLTVPLSCPSIIFDRIPWSCERTANVQITRLAEAGLSCIMGEELGDVDEPEDLEQLWKSREQKRHTHPRTFRYLETVMKDRNQKSQAISKLPDWEDVACRDI